MLDEIIEDPVVTGTTSTDVKFSAFPSLPIRERLREAFAAKGATRGGPFSVD